MKFRTMMKKYGPALGVTSLALIGTPAFAAAGDIDTAEALGYILAAVVAAGAVGAAMFGLVALIGAQKKAQRAGS